MGSASSVPAPLQAVWLARRELIVERIKAVQLTLTQLAQGVSADTDAALVTAHQLRGSLGTFGFATGSALLGDAERLLASGDGSATELTDLAERLRVLEADLAAGD